MAKLHFATGGIPLSTKKRSTLEGVKRIHELGLDAMELEFGRGVRMSQETAEELREVSQDLGVKLTAHGPYYVNLAAIEPRKRGASRSYIEQTAQVCDWVGADRCTFHPAAYLKREAEVVYAEVKEQLIKLQQELAQKELSHIRISPELTGKPTQFGNPEELIRLHRELPDIHFCIDFAHLQARTGGAKNGYDDFSVLLRQISDGCGDGYLSNLYMHMSGIEFSEKGEKKHLELKDASIDWQGLMKALREFEVGGVLICESPNLETDALRMKEYFEKL